ncbi:MAG: HAD-IIIC family phosphatase [Bacillota bacterium]
MYEIKTVTSLNDDIKLVIWDLDDTFWKGTISEGNVELIESNINFVKQLVDRGIMNSICSKNDFTKVKEYLEKANLWNYFIFPQISWNPKGLMVKEILKNTQFRAQNTLFVDDNHMNLEEVKYYNPDIYLASPDSISNLISNIYFIGKNDNGNKRLKQYKNLESRSENRQNFGSNYEFLVSSNICVQIIYDCIPYCDRICELICRANQLNFTKKRIDEQELMQIIENPDIETACVQVRDSYGDYGIVGFYAMENNKLLHFVFSCRVLNLGVEQWIYSRLHFPNIDVIGAVAVEINKYDYPDWINQGERFEARDSSNIILHGHVKCLIKGGCDLTQLNHYLAYKNIDVDAEFNFVSNTGYAIHNEHSEILRVSDTINEEEKEFLFNNIIFYDKNIFKTKIFDAGYNIVVYSVLMDYTQALYRYKNNEKIIVAYGDFGLPLTSKENWALIEKLSDGKTTSVFLEWFANNFEYIGPISEQRFVENLQWIRNNVSKNTLIVFINGCEINLEHKWESDRYLRHGKMNFILDEFVKKNDNVRLIDVRKYVCTADDVVDSIRHYKRKHYARFAVELVNIIQGEFGVYRRSDLVKVVKKTYRNVKHYIKKAIPSNVLKFCINSRKK